MILSNPKDKYRNLNRYQQNKVHINVIVSFFLNISIFSRKSPLLITHTSSKSADRCQAPLLLERQDHGQERC